MAAGDINNEGLPDICFTANSKGNNKLYLNKGNFAFEPLPDEAQESPVFSMFGEDVNNDGRKDIICGGNFYGVLPYEGRYDANWGDILLNKNNQDYQWLSPQKSGWLMRGEVRDIKKIKTANGYLYAVARNNDSLLFFKSTLP